MATDLEQPIWSALLSDNAAFGSGTAQVKLFDPEIAPFAGLANNTPENFRTLFAMVEDDRNAVIFSIENDLDPHPFEIVVKMAGHQMVFQGNPEKENSNIDLVRLTEKDVPEMLALTQLTQPGPFAPRTISFGGYWGVYVSGKLVAMGGQRLQALGHTEISAICTHPDHLGKGYGAAILQAIVRDITSEGRVAYLHVRADNTRAIALYQRLGFVTVRDMNFYVLKKPGELTM